MNALRCSDCGIAWPADQELYGSCPVCEGETSEVAEQPMDAEIALSAKRHADFERFYQARQAA